VIALLLLACDSTGQNTPQQQQQQTIIATVEEGWRRMVDTEHGYVCYHHANDKESQCFRLGGEKACTSTE
jgi:putative heme degradation protein